MFFVCKKEKKRRGLFASLHPLLFEWMTRHVFSGSVLRFVELLFCRTSWDLGSIVSGGSASSHFLQNTPPRA